MRGPSDSLLGLIAQDNQRVRFRPEIHQPMMYQETTRPGGEVKYLCMVVVDEKNLSALSEKESQALDDESLAYDDVLRKNGHWLAAQALEFVHAAKTVRLQNGKRLITDGPFTETKEQVGGFILIEAGDMDEAIQLASKIPAIRLGAVEVRPVKELISSNTQM